MKQKTGRKLLSFLLTLAMVIGLVPGMGLTAYAESESAAEILKPTVSEGKVTNAKILWFARKPWYVIASGNTGAQLATGAVSKEDGQTTLVLLAVESEDWGDDVKFSENGSLDYSTSVLKTTIDGYDIENSLTNNDSWMKDLIAKRSLTGVASSGDGWSTEDNICGEGVTGATLWPLSANEASKISSSILKYGDNNRQWWLRSPGPYTNAPACVEDGSLTTYTYDNELYVRPALCLNLTDNISASVLYVSGRGQEYQLTINYPLWVGGTQVTSANASNIDGNNKASYNAETKTLTLNGYDSHTPHEWTDLGDTYSAIIYSEHDLAINIVGNNTITNNTKTKQSRGIYTKGNLTITGEGSITVVSEGKDTNLSDIGIDVVEGDVTISSGTVSSTGSDGIIAVKNVIINGSSIVNATSSASAGYGILAAGGAVTISGNSNVTTTGAIGSSADNVTINGGTVSANGYDYGIVAGYDDAVIISGGAVTATGNTQAISGKIKNTIAGTGWTNTEGTDGRADIAVSTTARTLDNYKKLLFIAHTHSFSYSVGTGNGADTITATCSADGCPLPEVNDKHTATLTIAAPQHTNVGDNKSAEATITDANSIKGSATVSYYAATKNGAAYTKTGNALGNAPTAAGDYVAEITLGTGNNTATASVGYTIGKAASSVATVPTAVTDLTYDGTAKALVSAGTASGGTMQYALGANGTTAPTEGWDTSIPTGTDAGTYYVWYKVAGDDDHADSVAVCVPVTVNKATGGAATAVVLSTDLKGCTPTSIELEGKAGQEYVIVAKDGTPDWTNAAVPNSENTVVFLSLAPATEYEIYTRVKETANTLAGEPQRTAYVTSLESVGIFFDSDLVGGLGTADPDPAADGYTYRWYRADVTNDVKSNVEEISGATGKTYTVSADDVGKHVFYKVYKGGVEIGESSPLGPFASAATVTFNSMGGSSVATQTGLAYDAKLTKPADPERSGYHFAGWYTEEEYWSKWSFDVDTVKWAETTLYAKWTAAPVYEITGVVKDSSDAAVSGAAVTLAQGYKTLGQTTTDASGAFTFSGVESGTYNVIAKKETQTKTELVELTANQSLEIKLPAVGKNSVLDNDNAGDLPAIVGGLDKIAAEETVSGDSTVTITLTVTAEDFISDSKKAQFATEKAAIQTVAAGKTLECLDLTLQKVVTGTGAVTTNIGDSNTQLLTIIIPYATSGKQNVAVYRYHGTTAEALMQNPASDEEGFVVGTDSITLYAKGFSTYAIGYTTPAPTPTPSYSSSGGGGSSSSGSTVTVPVSGDSASVSVSASVSGATATVKAPTTAQLDKVIGESVKTGDVTIDVSGLNRNIATVSIPTETVKAIEKAVSDPDNDADALTVKLTDGSVTFDAAALAAIAQQAKGSTIQLNLDNIGESKLKTAQKTAIRDLDVQAVYDAYMTSNGQRISDFKGGKAAVTVNYTLKDGQTGRGVVVWYVADDGKTTEVPTTYTSKEVTFTVEHFSNYVIAYDAQRAAVCPKDDTCPISAFTDASATAWYHDGVHWVLENSVMSGYGNGKFGPGDTTSRAMMAQILWNMEGKPVVNHAMSYTDVDADAWYAEAVRWATAQGIMNGYGGADGGKFGPNDDMTREQLVTIMYRYAQMKKVDVSIGEDTNILSYDDAFDVSEWAIPAMQWAVGAEIVNGTSASTLSPKNNASRAEIATIVMRYCEKNAK